MSLIESEFTNARGQTIHTKRWRQGVSNRARAAVLLVHGLGEHCGRYDGLVAQLTGDGYNVYSMDHSGHGKSSGDRAYVKTFNHYVEDIIMYHELSKDKEPKKQKWFLLGHSMGALLSLLLSVERPDEFIGVILSGPPLDMGKNNALSRGVLSLFGSLFAKSGLVKLPASAVCGNKDVVAAYESDPLVYHGGLKWGFLQAFAEGQLKAYNNLSKIKYPMLVVHGGGDTICPPKGAHTIVDGISSEDKELIIYDGMLHEIFNEDDKQKVFDDVLKWMDQRAPPKATM